MKILTRLATFFTFLLFLFMLRADNAFAVTADVSPGNRDENITAVTITYSGLTNGTEYSVCFDNDPASRPGNIFDSGSNCSDLNKIKKYTATGNSLSITVCGDKSAPGDVKEGACGPTDWFLARDDYNVRIYRTDNCCNGDDDLANANFDIKHYIPTPINVGPSNPKSDTTMTIFVFGHRRPADNTSRNTYDIDLKGLNGTNDPTDPSDFTVPDAGTGVRQFGPLETGTYELTLFYDGEDHSDPKNLLAKFIITVENDADGGSITGGATSGGSGGGLTSGRNPCPGGECLTALGPISTNLKAFSEKILSIATGIAGGIAFILMVIGAIRILTSQGDPKGVAGGREMLVAALAGLLFLIFSVLILRFIGINLLGGIPGIS